MPHALQKPINPLNGVFRQVDHGGFHSHHSPPSNIDGKRRQMVEMRVGHEPGGRSHEVPRLRSQIETDLELRYPPICLNRRARITFDGNSITTNLLDRSVFDHE